MVIVNGRDGFLKRSREFFLSFIQQGSLESIAHKNIVKVCFATPKSAFTDTAFRKKTVDVGIPFQIPAEGMQDKDKAGSKEFCLSCYLCETCVK